jgi:uncharacterized protein involved in outer membrane biogenesis
VLSLQHQTTPYPIMVNLRMEKTVIEIVGTLTKPTELEALDMNLKISALSMGRLYGISEIVLPVTPTFVTEGHLLGALSPQGNYWSYEKFSGKVGSSDITGSLDFQAKHSRGVLSGTIVSHSLRFSDLSPMIGADSNANNIQRGADFLQPPDKVLPAEPFNTEH